MALKWKKRVLLAKIESTPGTDATPTGAANAILVSDVQITPLAGDTISRDLIKPSLGASPKTHVGVHSQLTCTVELAGAGTAGDAPAWAPLLLACGFSETLDVGVDAVYAPISANEPTLTLYFHMDGQKHALLGCRGSVSFALSRAGNPSLSFSFTGFWTDPASVADPTPDFSNFEAPVHISKGHTPTFILHGQALEGYSLDVDMAVQVVHEDLIGAEEITIADRDPKASLKFRAPAISVLDVFSTAKDGTTGALQLIHGTQAGNIIQIDAPKVQILEPKYGDEQGVATIDCNLSLISTDAGDDEITITVK